MSPEVSPRRRARELVLKRLYAHEIGEISSDQVLTQINDDTGLSEKNQTFAREFFLLVIDKTDWANGAIQKLAENWDIDRLAAVDRIIMRMALVELEHVPDIPVKVAINEAIELGKKYSTAGSASFINGILDSFAAGQSEAESKTGD